MMQRKTQLLVKGFIAVYVISIVGFIAFDTIRGYHPGWISLWESFISTLNEETLLGIIVLEPLAFICLLLGMVYVPRFIRWVDKRI
jgi:hypothetical protein